MYRFVALVLGMPFGAAAKTCMGLDLVSIALPSILINHKYPEIKQILLKKWKFLT
jgi:hypothetical protein